MARKGKRERQIARQQWAAFRAYRDELVGFNLANPDSEHLAPNVIRSDITGRKGYHQGRMDLSRSSEHGTRARVSQLIVKGDPIRKRKALERKFRLNDADLYGELNGEVCKPTGKGGSDVPQVRTGTTKPQIVVTNQIGDNGKPVMFRVGPKPRFRPVGDRDSVPKDGAKY